MHRLELSVLAIAAVVLAACAREIDSEIAPIADEASHGAGGDDWGDGGAPGDDHTSTTSTGAGAGSSTGTTTSTTSTSTTTTTGTQPADSCSATTSCDPCFDCAAQNECSAEAAACQASADCPSVDDCVYNCNPSDLACIDYCLSLPGADVYVNLASCVFCNACVGQCPELAAQCM